MDEFIKQLNDNPENIATRKASQNTLNVIGPILPELIGGSADLAPSNLTLWSGSTPVPTNSQQGIISITAVRNLA
ncbi:hypothetical protein MASR2M36_36550 [Providencia sp.]